LACTTQVCEQKEILRQKENEYQELKLKHTNVTLKRIEELKNEIVDVNLNFETSLSRLKNGHDEDVKNCRTLIINQKEITFNILEETRKLKEQKENEISQTQSILVEKNTQKIQGDERNRYEEEVTTNL